MKHRVTILHLYLGYQAKCVCGWKGEYHRTSMAARREYWEHRNH